MAKSIRVNPKKRGRPKTTGRGTLIGVRLQSKELALLDAWIAQQKDGPSRPEALRRLASEVLAKKSVALGSDIFPNQIATQPQRGGRRVGRS
jgi:hypothetical protein